MLDLIKFAKTKGWKLSHANGTNDENRDNLTLHLYRIKTPEAWRERNRQRQAAGVKFEWCNEGIWRRGYKGSLFTFDVGGEEDYREVPQLLPHAAERALWKAQREAGTNEVWQGKGIKIVTDWFELDAVAEPLWHPDFVYRPKPKPAKLKAKIARKIGNSGAYDKPLDGEFTGTIEEYRAKCEKYGYDVVSEIKEVVEKPKTVKYYMAMFCSCADVKFVKLFEDKNELLAYANIHKFTIIGNIEEREVPIE